MTRVVLPFARRFPTVALVLALAAFLAACNGAETPEPATETTPEATTDATEDEGAEAPEETGTEPTDEDEPTLVRIAFVPATTGLLLNVADQQGFFADNGLEVELTPAQNISEIIPALGQQFEISLGTSTDLIRAADGGLDVVQISGNTISTEDNPFAQVITRPDTGIESVTDLEGRTVAAPTLSGVIHIAVRFWAQQEGIDPESIRGVQVPPPNHPDQLASEQVDAVEALEPFASGLLAQGNVSLGNPFAAIRLPLATNFWMANGEWARANPDVVEDFGTALAQAKEFVESGDDNEATARQILQEYTGMPPQVAETVPLPTFDLDVRVDDLGAWIEVLRELGEYDGDVDPQDLVL